MILKKMALCMSLMLCLLPARSVLAAASELTFDTYSWGNEVIAPGQHSEYHIIVSNITEPDLDYIIRLEHIGPEDIPLRVKLKQGDQYLLGTEDTWVDIGSAIDARGTFSETSAQELILIWEWCYYSDVRQDQRDTLHGKAGSEYVGLQIDVSVWEDESVTLKRTSGIPVLGEDNTILKWSLAAFVALYICVTAAKRRGGQP